MHLVQQPGPNTDPVFSIEDVSQFGRGNSSFHSLSVVIRVAAAAAVLSDYTLLELTQQKAKNFHIHNVEIFFRAQRLISKGITVTRRASLKV